MLHCTCVIISAVLILTSLMWTFYLHLPQVEAELEASRNHIREESDRINSEAVKLKQDHFKLKTESEAVAKERERLEALSKEVEHRSQKAESLHQVMSRVLLMCSYVYMCMCKYLKEFSITLLSHVFAVCIVHKEDGRRVSS